MTIKRSNEQNAYYWGIVLPEVVKAVKKSTPFDWDANDVHVHFKRFLPKGVLSTADLTTGQMEDYLTRVRNFAHRRFKINIPLPNEK